MSEPCSCPGNAAQKCWLVHFAATRLWKSHAGMVVGCCLAAATDSFPPDEIVGEACVLHGSYDTGIADSVVLMEVLARDDVDEMYRRFAARDLGECLLDEPFVAQLWLDHMTTAPAHAGLRVVDLGQSTWSSERDLELALALRMHPCRTQVECATGVADIVSADEVVEVKLALTRYLIRKAVGQAVAYAGALGLRPAIAGVADPAEPHIIAVSRHVRVYAVKAALPQRRTE